MTKPDQNSTSACSFRLKIFLLALLLWLGLSLPSVIMTMILGDASDGRMNQTDELVRPEEDFTCYENFTVYHPIFVTAQFWSRCYKTVFVRKLQILC